MHQILSICGVSMNLYEIVFEIRTPPKKLLQKKTKFNYSENILCRIIKVIKFNPMHQILSICGVS